MTEQNIARIKRAVIRKYPIFASIALLNVPITEDKNIKTAAVIGEKTKDGNIELKGIKYNAEFLDSLTFEQQVFVMAHETCHIAFKHFARSLEKPEKDIQRKYEEYCSKEEDENKRKIEKARLHRKYNNFWNIATDACINAFLKKDGLQMPEGVIDKRTGQPMNFVNIADGLYRRAELIYDALVKKDKEKNKDNSDKNVDKDSMGDNSSDEINENSNEDKNENEQKNNSSNKPDEKESESSNIGGDLDDIDIDNYEGIDSHEEWVSEPKKSKETQDSKEDFDEEDKSKKSAKSLSEKLKDFFDNVKKDKKPKQKNLDDVKKDEKVPEISTDEASVFKENEKKLNEEKLNEKDEDSINKAFNNITEEAGCSHIEPVKPVLSWKQILLRTVEEEIQTWGYRRANRYMPNARIQEVSRDEKSTTEIVLDTSGSISDELLRGFLRQLIPLFRETEIKVGCFGGYFHGFTELESVNEVQEFKATRDGGGTNFEAAATAFTKENKQRRINKIVFTDGQLDGYSSHIQKTKVDDIIWIVFGDEMDFNPLGGKIIHVNEKDLNEMLNIVSLNDIKIKFVEQDTVEKSKKR